MHGFARRIQYLVTGKTLLAPNAAAVAAIVAAVMMAAAAVWKVLLSPLPCDSVEAAEVVVGCCPHTHMAWSQPQPRLQIVHTVAQVVAVAVKGVAVEQKEAAVD